MRFSQPILLLMFPLIFLGCSSNGLRSNPNSLDSEHSEYVWGNAKDGLRVGIRQLDLPEEGSSTPQFRVAIQNVGTKSTVLWLGEMLANGKRQFTDKVTLVVSDVKFDRELLLKHNGDRLPGIAGRVDRMLVPLAIGCTYEVRVDFDNYWFVKADGSIQDWLPKGDYAVTASFLGKAVPEEDRGNAILSLPYWIGELNSGTLSCRSLGIAAGKHRARQNIGQHRAPRHAAARRP